jgi:acetyltransferase-like isoleucine patch superfamily enzyme
MPHDWFAHPHALCETTDVGPRTRIWAFAHVLPGARIGADCNICDHVFIENDVVVGDRVTVKCGVQVWDGIQIDDDVFVGPNVTFTNDRFPRSRRYQESVLRTRIHTGASIGANATLLPGIEIGAYAMIGAGAVVTRSVPPHAIAIGNPARIKGYADSRGAECVPPLRIASVDAVTPIGDRGVAIYRMPVMADIRGSLSVGEFDKHMPFSPKRYFFVYGVPSKETRGQHAHRECHQMLSSPHGSITVLVDDGRTREEVVLDNPGIGLYLPPLVWAVQYKYSANAVLFVLASHEYAATDYIRDYGEFRLALESSRAA